MKNLILFFVGAMLFSLLIVSAVLIKLLRWLLVLGWDSAAAAARRIYAPYLCFIQEFGSKRRFRQREEELQIRRERNQRHKALET